MDRRKAAGSNPCYVSEHFDLSFNGELKGRSERGYTVPNALQLKNAELEGQYDWRRGFYKLIPLSIFPDRSVTLSRLSLTSARNVSGRNHSLRFLGRCPWTLTQYRGVGPGLRL